jgi:hypothetical protein
MDIDVHILDTEGRVIFQTERETEGKTTFVAEERGSYKICFSNLMSSLTPKTVSFNVHIGIY